MIFFNKSTVFFPLNRIQNIEQLSNVKKIRRKTMKYKLTTLIAMTGSNENFPLLQ